jgi:hypothetical protein
MKILKPRPSDSGFVVVPVHYSHDPEKTPVIITELRKSYDRVEDFNREMELDFTAQKGSAAYPAFSSQIHVKKELTYRRNLPLCLACDFNVDPCVFEVCQIRGGNLFVIDEICQGPTSIPDMITEFRNLYPDHPAEIHIYGDSMGHRRDSQTEKSDYGLVQIHMQGYPSKVLIKVPRHSPASRSRINSVNNRLKGYEGIQRVFIDSSCKELIADFNQVVLKADGKDVLKVYKESDPYARRTHASDCIGYIIHREWPLSREALKLKSKAKKRKPLKYGKLLGDI